MINFCDRCHSIFKPANGMSFGCGKGEDGKPRWVERCDKCTKEFGPICEEDGALWSAEASEVLVYRSDGH
jgi:hypothetical protein